MALPKDIQREYPAVSDWNILLSWRGSVAHGTFVPNTEPGSIDDKDVQGICVPPPDYYTGLKQFGSQGTQEIKRGKWDVVVFEARKAMAMLRKGNPNIVTMLWMPENGHLKRTRAGDLILDNRELFVGKHLYKPFVGYATGQAHKMEHLAFEGYMGEKRKSLVHKHGYDTKNAAHLIRLLRMAVEFLTTGEFNVQRHDAAELIAIKQGEWTLERVKREAERLRALADEAYVRSSLPPGPPDFEAVSDLTREVVEVAWADRYV